MASRQVEKSYKKSVASLARTIEEDIESGKVERWHPPARAN